MAEQKITTKIAKNHSDSTAAAPPAYFLSLTVSHFRCFGPEQTLDLSDGNGRPAPWTVILGDNGVGKTTLLQLISSLQPTQSSQSDFFLPRLNVVWKAADAFTHLPEINSLKSNGAVILCDIITDAHLHSSILRDSVNYVKNFGVFQHAANLWGLGASQGQQHDISGLICYGYGASRQMGITSLSESSESDACASLFDSTATLINAAEWLLQADYAASKKSPTQEKARVRRDQIKDVLINLLPDVTDIRISQAEKGFSSFVEVETPYGWVPIQGLSLGYRTLISWMVDFASRLFERYPDSENPLAEPAVCLVDEIDLHLHPRWQRTLMSFLSDRFPNTQFIATAHSPLVVQAAQNANIVVLRREGDHVVIDNDVESIKNWRVDQILTSDLFGLDTARPAQLDDAIKERNKILGKAKLTKKDRARLEELEAQIGDLPTGETPENIEAMDIIRRAAHILKNGKAA